MFFPVRPDETMPILRSRLCGLFDNIGHSGVTQRSKIVNSPQHLCALHPDFKQQQTLAAPEQSGAANKSRVYA
jgi:hypothetical protein